MIDTREAQWSCKHGKTASPFLLCYLHWHQANSQPGKESTKPLRNSLSQTAMETECFGCHNPLGMILVKSQFTLNSNPSIASCSKAGLQTYSAWIIAFHIGGNHEVGLTHCVTASGVTKHHRILLDWTFSSAPTSSLAFLSLSLPAVSSALCSTAFHSLLEQALLLTANVPLQHMLEAMGAVMTFCYSQHVESKMSEFKVFGFFKIILK